MNINLHSTARRNYGASNFEKQQVGFGVKVKLDSNARNYFLNLNKAQLKPILDCFNNLKGEGVACSISDKPDFLKKLLGKETPVKEPTLDFSLDYYDSSILKATLTDGFGSSVDGSVKGHYNITKLVSDMLARQDENNNKRAVYESTKRFIGKLS